MKYTTIYHLAKKELNLTFVEYCLSDSIRKLQGGEKNPWQGWCHASNKHFVEFIGCTEQGVNKSLKRLIEKEVLSKRFEDGRRLLRVRKIWDEAHEIKHPIPQKHALDLLLETEGFSWLSEPTKQSLVSMSEGTKQSLVNPLNKVQSTTKQSLVWALNKVQSIYTDYKNKIITMIEEDWKVLQDHAATTEVDEIPRTEQAKVNAIIQAINSNPDSMRIHEAKANFKANGLSFETELKNYALATFSDLKYPIKDHDDLRKRFWMASKNSRPRRKEKSSAKKESQNGKSTYSTTEERLANINWNDPEWDAI